uniref:Splicing factor n=1 Tax=Tanacetum cinerariifolium TaxID=118510 RepID=A0A699QXY0_TANCI|nr:splicing factor [Tanacetum cinerariifolium]
MEFISEESNGVLSDGSNDEYYSSDEIKEFDDVDFHTEGEENVVIKNLTTHDLFLNKLCGNNGMFMDYIYESVPQTKGKDLDDPNDAHIDHIHKSLFSDEDEESSKSAKSAPKSSKKGAKSVKSAGKSAKSAGKSTKSAGKSVKKKSVLANQYKLETKK